MLKLITLMVVLVLTVVGARSCSSSGPSSPLNPVNVARNGLQGLCANQQAVADASGENAPDTVVPPGDQGQPGLGALEQAAGGSLSCSTTTTVAGQ